MSARAYALTPSNATVANRMLTGAFAHLSRMTDSKTINTSRHVPRGRKKSKTGAMERLMTIADVADYLGVPVQTIYFWRVEGKGPKAHKIGRHLRFAPEDVRAYVAEQPD